MQSTLLHSTPCHQHARLSFTKPRQPWHSSRASAARLSSRRLCGCSVRSQASPDVADSSSASQSAASQEADFFAEQARLNSFANNLGGQRHGSNGSRLDAADLQTGPVTERAFLVGVAEKGHRHKFSYTIGESLDELGRLAETAGLEVNAVPAAYYAVSVDAAYRPRFLCCFKIPCFICCSSIPRVDSCSSIPCLICCSGIPCFIGCSSIPCFVCCCSIAGLICYSSMLLKLFLPFVTIAFCYS